MDGGTTQSTFETSSSGIGDNCDHHLNNLPHDECDALYHLDGVIVVVDLLLLATVAC